MFRTSGKPSTKMESWKSTSLTCGMINIVHVMTANCVMVINRLSLKYTQLKSLVWPIAGLTGITLSIATCCQKYILHERQNKEN